MPIDCTGNLTADIVFDCANAPIGGIEQNVVLINKEDIDYTNTTTDATNRIMVSNLQLKAGKTGYLLTGVKQANGKAWELVKKENAPDKFKHTFRVWNSGDFDAALKADLIDGKVPASQLPSFVDDVLEHSTVTTFPDVGETGKVYIALDTNKTYRWSGSDYIIIGTDLALGETSATAYRGDRGKTAYDHSLTLGNPHNTQIEHIDGLQNTLDEKANSEKTLVYKGLIALGADLNDYKITGIYIPQDPETCTNIPSANSGKLEVVIDQYNNIYQTYHDNNNDCYTRIYRVNEGLWSTWEKLSKTSNIVVDSLLTSQQTNASLNAVHSDKSVSFMLVAPNIDKGKLFIKTSQTRWFALSGDLLLD